jgi:hypothetical protein
MAPICPLCRAPCPAADGNDPPSCPACGIELPAQAEKLARRPARRGDYPVAAPFAPPPGGVGALRRPAAPARPRRKVRSFRKPRPPAWAAPVVYGGGALLVLLGLGLLVYCFAAGDEIPAEEGPGAPVVQGPSRGGPRTPPPPVAPGAKAPPGKDNEKGPADARPSQEKHGERAAPPSSPAPGGPPEVPLPKQQPEKGEPEPVVPPPQEVTPARPTPALVDDQRLTRPLTFKVLRPVLAATRPVAQKRLRLAVTPAHYDNMGELLTGLGEGYKFTQLTQADLYSLKKLSQFDVIFLTCSSTTALDTRLNYNFRMFVEKGGTLYASDLRFDNLAGAFPDYIDRKNLRTGAGSQTVSARVVNPGLRDVLGERIDLNFTSGGWRAAAFLRSKAVPYLEGEFRGSDGKPCRAPLLVKFSRKKGAVIFTSFHNAAQNSELEVKLLKYLVFTAVTTQLEGEVRKSLLAGGFEPHDTRRLSASAGEATPAQRYAHAGSGPLQFALGFEGKGAKLRLSLTAPGGRTLEHEDSASFILEVPGAPEGEWRFTVTAVEAPFANYPFTLTVGKRAS